MFVIEFTDNLDSVQLRTFPYQSTSIAVVHRQRQKSLISHVQATFNQKTLQRDFHPEWHQQTEAHWIAISISGLRDKGHQRKFGGISTRFVLIGNIQCYSEWRKQLLQTPARICVLCQRLCWCVSLAVYNCTDNKQSQTTMGKNWDRDLCEEFTVKRRLYQTVAFEHFYDFAVYLQSKSFPGAYLP